VLGRGRAEDHEQRGPTPHITGYGEVVSLLVEQYRIVRGDEFPGIAAYEETPRVLADQLPNDLERRR
jgi:hypothetical protein